MKSCLRFAPLFIALISTASAAVTVAGTQFSRAQSDANCNPPAPVTSFKTTDAEIWVYAFLTGGQVNDVMQIDWVSPSGQIARTISFAPLSVAGNYCFDDALSTNQQGSSFSPFTPAPGAWTVRMTYNRTALTSLQMQVVSVNLTVRTFQLSKAATTGSCVLPSPVTSFLTSDTEIWSNFVVDDALYNDVIRADWINPSGAIVNTQTFNRLPYSGTWCFDSWLTKASDPHTPTAGAWTVRLTRNGGAAPIATLSAPINAPTGGGGGGGPATPYKQCPPIGADTGCAVLIVINADNTISVFADTNQKPFGAPGDLEDTLTGIQNNSNKTITALPLKSTTDIFGFDDDGICTVTPKPAGCPFGPTGYEGPGVSFSNISSDKTSGTVNFSPGIPPGGSAYFGLDEALTANQVTVPLNTTCPIGTATVGVAYSSQLVGTGGNGSYTWSLTAGSLAPLTVSAGGLVSGAPATAGILSFTLTIKDGAGASAQQSCTITVAGAGGTPALTVVLTPSTAGNPVGTQHTVTAKVTGANNVPQANVTVTFTILSGPNQGAIGVCSLASCKTDSTGQVSFTYTGSGGQGTDSIKACISAGGGSTNEPCCSSTESEPRPLLAKSAQVVFIGAAKVDPNCVSGANVVINGGCLPVTGKTGELGDFTFSAMLPSSVSAATLAPYDTAVLNVASTGMFCATSSLSAQARTDLVSFVGSGRKLIIYDSECQGSGGKGLDYSWLPYPFTTANPGAQGAQGTLNIVENSTLVSAVTGSASFVDAADLANNTDAVGDMNVMTTKDSHWCLAMSGTNALKVTGPVQAYAKYPAGTDAGLFIYHGLDTDSMDTFGNANLRKLWVLELQQPFNASNLPCGVAVVGITLAPATATNPTGTPHTVSAKVVDQTGKPQSGVTVAFTITGTNASAAGSCNPAGCKTDSNGQVSFTYTGSGTAGFDSIQACFTPPGGTPVCSTPVGKTWVAGAGATQICSTPVTKTWTAAGPTCNYFVQPLTNLGVPAAGTNNGFFQIFTGLSCKWGAVSNDSFITIVAGASGQGSPGAVSYRVAANPNSTPRTGTITITDGSKPVQTHTVTQLPGGPPCTYGISPLFGAAPASGGGGGFLISTASTCFWLATPNDSWVHVTPSSGYGSQTVHYSGDVNPTTTARTGTIGIMGQTFTVYQPAPPPVIPPNTPSISTGGILNAASNQSGPIARGSFFTIYGNNIGPAVPVQATSYPIPDTMGGVVVNVSQGSVTRRAFLHFVSSSQINGIIPSNSPLGDVQITVSLNGVVSASATATLVDTSFGIFSSAAYGSGPGIVQNWNSPTDVVLNLPSIPANSKQQILVLWGTGLGPITSGDNNQPPGGDLPAPVQVEIGGILVSGSGILYHGRAPGFAAVDNIYFNMPPGVPEGCSVPVRVNAAGTWSNTVRIALSSSPNSCKDSVNPYSGVTISGTRMGNIVLLRARMVGQFQAGQAPADVTVDLGGAIFNQTKAGGQLAFSGALNLPPLGACESNSRALDVTSLLGGDLLSQDPTVDHQLDAGTSLTVSTSKGSADLTTLGSNQGSYMGLLGGTVPLSGSASTPLILDPGTSVTVKGSGGKDVASLTANISMPAGVAWTNRDQIGTIDRSAPVTVTWTGGDASTMVIIAGGSEDSRTQNAGGFFCLAPSTAGTFTIPASNFASLPVTRPLTGNPGDTFAALSVISVPQGNPPKFNASGLDNGYIIAGIATLKAVQVK